MNTNHHVRLSRRELLRSCAITSTGLLLDLCVPGVQVASVPSTSTAAVPSAAPLPRQSPSHTRTPIATDTQTPTHVPTPAAITKSAPQEATPGKVMTLEEYLQDKKVQAYIGEYAAAKRFAPAEVTARLLGHNAIFKANTGGVIIFDPKTQVPLVVQISEEYQLSSLGFLGDRADIVEGVFFAHTELPGMKELFVRELGGHGIACLIHDFGWDRMEKVYGDVRFKGQWGWAKAEEHVNFALSHGMRIMTGFPFWRQEYPEWFEKGDFEPDLSVLPDWVDGYHFNSEQKRYLAQCFKHTDDITGYLKGKITAFRAANPDAEIQPPIIPVLNECAPQGVGGDDVLLRVFSTEREQQALITALYRRTKEDYPEAVLIYNNAYNDTPGEFGTNDTIRLIKPLAKSGYLDGVGIQAHLDATTRTARRQWAQVMRNYAKILRDAGVESPFVMITEKDINLWKIPGNEEQRFSRQAEVNRAIVGAGVEAGIKAIVNFGYTDERSWLEEVPSAPGYSKQADPTLFTLVGGKYVRKPAYWEEAGALFYGIRRQG